MSIKCVQSLKSFSLGVDRTLRDEWAYQNGMWRRQKPGYRDKKWFEDYVYGVTDTVRILSCWLNNYLPGVDSWADYGDVVATFDMGDVEKAGWSEFDLREALRDMTWHVRACMPIHAKEPWQTSSLDGWGEKVYRYRHPAIEPLKHGMIDRDDPRDLETL